MDKHILVKYAGGGYEGCVWEWNYFVIDRQGVFHNIVVTGRNGIETEEAVEEGLDGTEHYIYQLDCEEAIDVFQSRSNAGHVIGVSIAVERLIENGVDVERIFWRCDDCGEKFYGAGCLSGLESCGGIAMNYTEKKCDDCEAGWSENFDEAFKRTYKPCYTDHNPEPAEIQPERTRDNTAEKPKVVGIEQYLEERNEYKIHLHEITDSLNKYLEELSNHAINLAMKKAFKEWDESMPAGTEVEFNLDSFKECGDIKVAALIELCDRIYETIYEIREGNNDA